MLILPAESSAANRPVNLKHRHLNELACYSPSALAGLGVCDSGEGVAVYRLDEAVAKHVQRRTESSDLIAAGNAFLYLGVGGPIIIERPARLVNEVSPIKMPCPQLSNLAYAVSHGILVALGAGLRIVNGA